MDEAEPHRLDRMQLSDPVQVGGSALDNTLQTWRVNLSALRQSPGTIYNVLRENVLALRPHLPETARVIVSLLANFHLIHDANTITDPPPIFNSISRIVLPSSDRETILSEVCDEIIAAVDNYEMQGSGWVLHQLLRLELTILAYEPLRASTYIPLPSWVHEKRAVVNVQNKDNRCFLWGVIAALHPVADHRYRVTNYMNHEH